MADVDSARTYVRVAVLGFWSAAVGGTLVFVAAKTLQWLTGLKPVASPTLAGAGFFGIVAGVFEALTGAGTAGIAFGTVLLVLGVVGFTSSL